jgi:hypothetical protein
MLQMQYIRVSEATLRTKAETLELVNEDLTVCKCSILRNSSVHIPCHELDVIRKLRQRAFSDRAKPFLRGRGFAHRVRMGTLARNAGNKPVRSRTVEDYLRSVGQGFTSVGALDPRHQVGTTLTDFRLYRQLRCYSKQDPPPSRVKPLPLGVLHNVRQMASLYGDQISLAVSDLSYMAFFCILRPGEYCSSTDSHPFRLCDVQLYIGNDRLDPLTCALDDLDPVTFVTLTFTTQKNGVRGESIGHARSRHLYACPVVSVVTRIRYLHLYCAPPDTPLCAVRSATSRASCTISSRLVTETIRTSAAILGQQLIFNAGNVSARSCRAGDAMALLCGRVDTSIIQLVGRSRSDVILRYLHLQVGALMSNLSSTMLRTGAFHLIPGQDVPNAAASLLVGEVPAYVE